MIFAVMVYRLRTLHRVLRPPPPHHPPSSKRREGRDKSIEQVKHLPPSLLPSGIGERHIAKPPPTSCLVALMRRSEPSYQRKY